MEGFKKESNDIQCCSGVADQKGLCAYCEMSIHENKGSVGHFIPRKQSIKENNYD